MRVLLLGAAGQLGRHLQAICPPSLELLTSSRSDACHPCDLSDHQAVIGLLDKLEPAVIVNAAAWTAVDAAEDHPDQAHVLNAELPGWLSAWCAERASGLITYSTDYVFSGRPGRPWREDDPPAPRSVYGQSKLEGEQRVAASGAKSVVIRTAWVYSHLPGNFLRAILARAADGQALKVVADQQGSPTWAGDLAAVSWALLARWQTLPAGMTLLHAAGSSPMSWHAFAALAVSYANKAGQLTAAVEVKPIDSSEWPQRAERPRWSVLDSSRIEQLTGHTMMTADQALEACLKQWRPTPS
ncbi:MAG: dTDP-4-dehydrorhamnose reductase [Wenzhouxiangella sp.]